MRLWLSLAIATSVCAGTSAQELPPRWAPDGVQAVYGPCRLVESCPLALLVSDDGRKLYSVHSDRICAWDRATQRCSHAIGFAIGNPTLLATELDHLESGKWAESIQVAAWVPGAAAIGLIRAYSGFQIIDPETRQRQKTGIKLAAAKRLTFSNDGKRLLALLDDDTQRLLDVVSGKTLWESKSGARQRGACALAPDGTTVALARSAGAVELINLATKEIDAILNLESTAERVTHIAYTADGRVLSVAGPNQVSFYAVPDRKFLACLPLPREGEWDASVLFSPDGRRAVIRMSPQRAAIVEVATAQLVGWLDFQGLLAGDLVFGRDGKTVFGASSRVAFRTWDIEACKEIAVPAGHTGPIFSAAMTPDRRKIVSMGVDPDFCIWDIESGQLLKHGRIDGLSNDPRPILAADGTMALAVDRRGRIAWIDLLSSRTLLREPKIVQPTALAFGAKDKVLYVGGPGFESRGIDTQTGTVLWEDSGLVHGGHCAVATPDGKSFVVGTRNGSVRCRDAFTGKDLWRIEAGGSRVTTVAIDHDGQRVAAGNAAGEIIVLSAATGKKVYGTTRSNHAVADLSFSPDGRLLAIGVNHAEAKTQRMLATVQVHELATGQEIASLPDQPGPLTSLFFSPDGRELFTANWQGYVFRSRWLASPDSVVKHPNEAIIAWSLLGDSDGAFAHIAMARLVHNPDEALRAFKTGMKPEAELLGKIIGDLIVDLEKPRFADRERAGRQLAQLNWRAKNELQKLVSTSTSEEARNRASQLVRAMGDVSARRSDSALKRYRTCAVLEEIGTLEARAVLKELANDWSEAKAVLNQPSLSAPPAGIDLRKSIIERASR
ncbi:MAG TPA: WD40 repeat domain-containing protein [Gemmataceae bacterium]|nr:WD40 repeat domain-containing protein [Gemmataceae bacterium]